METMRLKMKTIPTLSQVSEMGALRTFWPMKKKMFSVGNLLIFRQEVELIAKIQGIDKILVHLVGDESVDIPGYLTELFQSEQEFIFIRSELENGDYHWPEQNQRYKEETYSTLQRIVYLSKGSNERPCLNWSKNTIKNTKKILKTLRKNKKRIYACHLKKQHGGSVESNADEESWFSFYKYFEKDPSVLFILLGADQISPAILSCKSVISAEKMGWSLSVQLAICQYVNGFIGMASGISCGAMFSEVPYVIFKHPSHHVEEMKLELGETDFVGFAQANQKILRQIDTFENLKHAFLTVFNRTGT